MELPAIKNLSEQLLEMNVSGSSSPASTHLNSPVLNSRAVTHLSSRASCSNCNYVGKLQEACVSNKWNLPSYDYISATGMSHNMTFSIKCSLGDLHAVGVSSTKKTAKQEAAKKMLDILDSTPPGATSSKCTNSVMLNGLNSTHYLNNNYQQNNMPERLDVNDPKILKRHAIGDILKSLTFEKLLDKEYDDLKDLLDNVCKEESINFTYKGIPSNGSGSKHWMVILNSPTLTVYHGCGDSDNEAQVDAARNALTVLKIMSLSHS